jgi:hypothetical protein
MIVSISFCLQSLDRFETRLIVWCNVQFNAGQVGGCDDARLAPGERIAGVLG